MADDVNGVLLLYHHRPEESAPTIMEHVGAFERHSQFKVWNVNTWSGFPSALSGLRFRAIVCHYSLFGIVPYRLNDDFLTYLDQKGSYKAAFFQDEFRYCQIRFDFLNRYRIDCVHTLVEPAHWSHVYQKYTHVPSFVYNIPGYVSDDLLALAEVIVRPDEEREIDIGYRGRTLPFYMGRGSQEKAEIGRRVLELGGDDLKLDIAVDEESRIYGDAWYRFLANCRATLGTEAGVSVFDLEDTVRAEYERLIAESPDLTFEEVSERLLGPWEGNVYYRTISPRHFEAAALRVCQILFEGKYSGILRPMEHYIPLKKDFSNWDDVLRSYRDRGLRRELTDNAHRDLVASGQYSYRRFVDQFDSQLVAAGIQPEIEPRLAERVTAILARDRSHRERAARLQAQLHRQFPGRQALKSVLKPVLKPLFKPLFTLGRRWYPRWKSRRLEKTLSSRADS